MKKIYKNKISERIDIYLANELNSSREKIKS